MNIKEIKEILKLLKEANVSEFEVERSNGKLRIKMNPTLPSVTSTTSTEPGPSEKEGPSPSEKQKLETEHLKTVTSPMVGTFYSAPSSDASPFVEEGSTVAKGDIICIIEAMKLMNEIEVEFDCKVVSILVENAQPVEYGEPLFLVEPV